MGPLTKLPGFNSGGGAGFGTSGGGGSPLMIVLIVLLGLGAVVFAGMTLVEFNAASTASKNLQAKEAAAADVAKATQKKADDEAYSIAGESPFRDYVAPVEDGSFQIAFPKDWSSYVDQETSGTQVSLALNPDFIRRTNATDELMAARVQLIERGSDQYMNAFTSYVKQGTLKQSDITISGLHGYDLTGQFSDKKTTREIVIPVRDKVLVFINENSKYANEFNQILAQSKIIP
jgi:hypothetical protein